MIRQSILYDNETAKTIDFSVVVLPKQSNDSTINSLW